MCMFAVRKLIYKEGFMNMSISGTASSNSLQTIPGNSWQQRRQNIEALSDALQSGDLSAAQQAFSSLSSSLPAGIANDPNSPLAKLGQALKSGDLSDAQSAFAAMHAHKGHRGHHHHHVDAAQPAASSSGASTRSVGTSINLTV